MIRSAYSAKLKSMENAYFLLFGIISFWHSFGVSISIRRLASRPDYGSNQSINVDYSATATEAPGNRCAGGQVLRKNSSA